jgi:hypothetical protein
MYPTQGVFAQLDAVTGAEVLAQYASFHRLFVQRKRQELTDPNFAGIGEIILPKMSLIHYLPKLAEDLGPSTSEAFIANCPDNVFIQFETKFQPVLGSGRLLTFDARKAIQAYRASHYTYNWTKDINTVWNKADVLVVKNYALAEKTWAQRSAMFMAFEQSYNRLNMLIEGINVEAERSNRRKQYVRIELPLNLPRYNDLMVDYEKFVGSFKDGLPVPSNPVIRVTKAQNSYWLLDLMAFLLGDYTHSQFGKLTPQAREDLHWIFTANSKALVINVKTLQEWLDELNPKDGSHPMSSSKRLNVTKRFYLALMTLSGMVATEKELAEESSDGRGEAGDEKEAGQVAPGSTGAAQKQRRASGDGEEGQVPRSPEHLGDSGTGGSLADVLRGDPGHHEHLDAGQGDAANVPDPEDAGDWTSAVDDKLLEVETTAADITVKRNAFPTPESGVQLALEERARDGVLTVAEQQHFMRKAMSYQQIEMENGQTLAEFMTISPEELNSLDGKIEGNFITVLDESMLRSRAAVLKREYAEKFLHKDIARMFVGIQNAGICLTALEHRVVNGVEGSYDVYKFQRHPVNGAQSTSEIRLPRVQKDATFTVDGVKQHLQLQRMELPIRKISPVKVALTSYYDRKLMISRSQKVVDDYSLWLVKQIRARGETKDGVPATLSYSLGSGYNPDYVSPRIYSILAKKFSFIQVGDLTLNFNIDELLKEHPDFKKYTKKESFLVGVKDGEPLWVDSFGNLYKGTEEINTVEGLMGISLSKAPIEYAVINISGFLFPIGVVLCYYFGIDELIKVVKATTRSVPMGTRPKLDPDEYAIAFNDEYLIFNRREKLASLIFGGMPKLNNISNFSRSDLNEKGIWVPLMGDPKVRPQQFKEMKLLFDLFIDPITKDELKRLGYSEDFHYLLIDAVKLLETDFSRHEVEIEEQRIVGYERFAGHVYRELVKSTRQYRNKGGERKHTLDINPEAVILNIITDTSVNLVEEVNPIHQLKDQEEMTFGGTGGRSEITMVKRARQQLDTYKGRVSEANKDSGKVGFVTYLTSDPTIKDFRGNLALDEKPTNTGLASITGNLMYGVAHDDPKRGTFTSTQASQAVSAQNYVPNILRTGMDNIVAHRTSELYSKVAAQDGKVTEVSDEFLKITYKDGTTDTYPLGLKIGEASGEYHRHTRVTDLKVGDKFSKGDVVGWDVQWFDRDPFCPGQVALKVGRMARIALVEDQDVYEDSLAIAKSLADESVTPFIKVKRFAIDVDWNIDLKVKVGDSVDYDSILCDVEEPHLVGDYTENELAMDINRIGIKQIRSNHHGKVVDIDVVYNATPEQMSKSVEKFIGSQDRKRKRLAGIEGSEVEKGAVSTVLNVNKPMLSPGKAFITIYVESMDPSTNADKYVIANQMKGTVGSIMHKPLMTEDGREVLIKSSMKGMFNRMVLSYRNKLISCELTIAVTGQAIAIYRGTNK